MIIDVSEHNGKLDWEKLKPQIEGAIIRCGFGSDYESQDDAYYERNVSECERLGIPYGVYIYSYANNVNKAKSEANHVKRLIKGRKLTFPVFYDLEEERYSSYANKMAQTWMDAMSGYEVGIYANVNWWKNYLTGVSCKNKWVAYWGSSQPSISNMVLWQYSDNGKVAGVSGFDLNKNIALPVPSPEPTPTPTPPPTPVATKSGMVKVNTCLNVRSGAGTSYPIVKQLSNQTTVTIYETKSGWYRIGDNQWVCADYVLIGKSYTVSVNSYLNVRSGPSTMYSSVGKKYNGNKVIVYEVKNNFGHIGKDQWCSMSYLK